jgi:DNA-binding GntR family transcriptional regulator
MEIQHKDLSSEVYKRIKAMILAKEFQPGEKIKQEQIAQTLGVSRMPLHKAFQMLENEMLVESIPRRGLYVTKIDNKQLIDAFECREALEGVAARRAAVTIKKADIAYLKSLFKPFVGKNDIEVKKYVMADQEFHNAILKLSGNAVLKRFEILSNITLHTYRGGLIRQPHETLPEHLEIIDALEKRDGELAENLIRDHSKKTCQILRQQLDENAES